MPAEVYGQAGRVALFPVANAKFDKLAVRHADSREDLEEDPILPVLGVDLELGSVKLRLAVLAGCDRWVLLSGQERGEHLDRLGVLFHAVRKPLPGLWKKGSDRSSQELGHGCLLP